MEKEISKPSDDISKDEEEFKKWLENPPIYISIRPLQDSGKIASLFYEFIFIVYWGFSRIVRFLTLIRSEFTYNRVNIYEK